MPRMGRSTRLGRTLAMAMAALTSAFSASGCIIVRDGDRDPRVPTPAPPVAPQPGRDGGTGRDGAGDVDAGDVDAGDDGLERIGIPVEGAVDRLPSMDEMIAGNPVVETATLTSTGAGDALTMRDGFRMDVPAGALPVGATISVTEHAVEGTVEGGGTRIYRFDASVEPSAPVSIAFPIPGPIASAGGNDVYVVWFHDDTDDAAEPELDHGTLDVAAGVVRVSTMRFSSAVVQQDTTVGADVGTDSFMVAPWYSQGMTLNCWSVTFAAWLTGYGRGQPGRPEVEPWDPNGFFRIDTQDGISFSKFHWSDETIAFVRRTVPGAVVRRTWIYVENADDYMQLSRLVRLVLSRGSPVVVGYPSHMVLYVGASGLDFLVNDPSEAPVFRFDPGAIMALATPWAATNIVSLMWIEAPLPQAPATPAMRASITVPHPEAGTNVGVRGASHVAVGPDQDRSTISGFSWYLRDVGGAGWANLESRTLGGPRMDQFLYPIVTVGNASTPSGEPQRMEVGMRVQRPDGTVVHTAEPRSFMLAPGAETAVQVFRTGGGLPISSLVTEPGAYQLVFGVSYQGTEEDTAIVPFPVSAPPSACVSDVHHTWAGTLSGSTTAGGDFSYSAPVDRMNADLWEDSAGDAYPMFTFNVVRNLDRSNIENGDLFVYGRLPSRPIGGMTYEVPLPRESTTFPDWFFQTPNFTCPVGGTPYEFGERLADDGSVREGETATGTMRVTFSNDCSSITMDVMLEGRRFDGASCGYTSRFTGTAATRP